MLWRAVNCADQLEQQNAQYSFLGQEVRVTLKEWDLMLFVFTCA